MVVSYSHTDDPTGTVSFPNLQFLHVNGEFPIRFMESLSAPNLKSLQAFGFKVFPHNENPFADPSQFPGLLMLEVELDGSRDVAATLALPFLRAHKELYSVRLPWSLSQEEDLVEVLGSTSLLPNLEHVGINDDFPELKGAEMLLERRVLQGPMQGDQHEEMKGFRLCLRADTDTYDRTQRSVARLVEKFGDSVNCGVRFDIPWGWPFEV